MPSIDINDITYSDGQLELSILVDNNVDQEAELSGSVGGPGFTAHFGPVPIPASQYTEARATIPASDDVIGMEMLVTASISESGVNTGDYPSKDEQRYITVQSGGGVDVGDPEFGGGGEVDDGGSDDGSYDGGGGGGQDDGSSGGDDWYDTGPSDGGNQSPPDGGGSSGSSGIISLVKENPVVVAGGAMAIGFAISRGGN